MVMMGQQLMDSERKQEDDEIDDYLIRPPNNNPNNRAATTTEEQKQNSNSQETMKKREVPTLASLAQESHQKLMGSSNGITDQEDVIVVNNNGTSGEGDNNNKVIKKHALELVGENGSKIIATENGSAKMNGHIQNHLEQDRPSDFQPSPVGGGVGGEATTTSSGRTSSCDSSGVGTSLTSSSSSEPVEREEVLSPSSDHEGDCGGVPIVIDSNGVVDENVPDNGNGNCSSSDDTVVTTIPNDVAITSDSCQALLLCEDYNEQMTAAKKFLKMVRDGINENGSGGTKPSAATSSRLKSGDSSTDEDATIISSSNGTVTNKPTTILSNGTTGNNNNVAVNNSAIIANPKEKSNASSSVRNGGSAVIPAVLAAALNKNVPVLERDHAPSCVQEVWAYNLLEEFAKIRRVVRQYTFIAMDTEFPGIVVRPQCAVRGAGVFPYELLKVNVDRLKIIQLGVTFMDKDGKCPPGVCTWQFNFKFSLNNDLYASDSISLLTRCGIQFERHADLGIEPEMFGEYFMSSGMVTSDQVTYLTFHSGFDFGYLIKLLSNLPLPDNEEKFFEIMKIYFPNVYDLKFLMKSVDLHGGLQDIANQMGQERVGTQHQAGSDSLLTGMTFFKLLSTDVFNGEIDENKYCGKLYGFHMNEDGTKDEGWSEIAGDNLLDATSPKPPPPSSRTSTSNNGTTPSSNTLHTTPTQSSQQQQHSLSSAVGNSSDNR